LCSQVVAQNWPGWRGDGSGISHETGIVKEWSETKNIRWKTEIPGYGHSSPIVWDDFIFLTTAQRAKEAKTLRSALLILLFSLTCIIIFWNIDTLFHFPRNPFKSFEFTKEIKLTRQFGRKAGVFMAYLLFGYGAFITWRWILEEFSPQLNSFGINWQLNGSTDGAGYIWASIGIISGVGVLFLNRVIDSWFSTKDPSRYTDRDLSIVHAAFMVVVMASFLGVNFMNILTLNSSTLKNYQTSWLETSISCSAGLIASIGSFHAGSNWRLAGGFFSIVFMTMLFLGTDDPANWYEHRKIYGLFYMVTIVSILGYMIQHIRIRLKNGSRAVSLSRLRNTGPIAILVIVVLQVLSVNVFASKPSFLYQVICLSRADGKIIWQTTCTKRESRAIHKRSSHATPTPVTDGERVYVSFGHAGTFCLDLEGNISWQNTDPTPKVRYGASSSPILWQNILIVTHDTDTRLFTTAFDKIQGHKLWEKVRDRHETEESEGYGTPVIFESAMGPQLIHHGFAAVNGYVPRTGQHLWSLSLPPRKVYPSPVIWNDMVILTAGRSSPKYMIAIRQKKDKETFEPEKVWESNRRIPRISSPVVYNDLVYSVTAGGIVTARDIRNGQVIWKTRLPFSSDYYASITAVDGLLFFSSITGDTIVMTADEEPTIISSNSLPEPIFSSMAVSKGEIFIRGEKYLYCISKKNHANL